MNNDNYIEYLNDRRGKIITQKGGWKIGKGVTSHGYSLLDELLGNASYFQVLVLNITGKLPTKTLAQWMEATFICLSWPDPRIWCNQIGAFGGASKATPVASICAGTMASESNLYGPGTAILATRFITSALQFLNSGGTINEFINKKARTKLGLNAPGYARPVAKGDERVKAMIQIAKDLGFIEANHVRTAFKLEKYLQDKYDESMNFSGYISAFLSDQGFNETQIYRMYSLCVSGGIHACYSETHDSQVESFLPLRCDDIEYVGTGPRPVPH